MNKFHFAQRDYAVDGEGVGGSGGGGGQAGVV